MKSVNDIIEDVIAAEGGYVNNKSDPGGETMYGITKATALRNGYHGPIKDLSISVARAIYYGEYVVQPGFDKVLLLSFTIAAELVDTGVNMGTKEAAKMLQQALNAFNKSDGSYPDLKVDGDIGSATINALKIYLKDRKERGQDVLLKALNCLQGARYIKLSEGNKKLKNFTFGWIDNRIKL